METKIVRKWAMPNKNTFSIKPVKDLICKYLKGKWIDIIHNINFHSDPEKGYFKIWVNGNLKVDEKGQTIWKTHGDVEKYFGKNRWDFKFGIYTTSKMAYKLYFDEIWIKRSCKNLKLGRLGYSCKKLNDQNGGVKPFVINVAAIS